jgi:hypothetical protein
MVEIIGKYHQEKKCRNPKDQHQPVFVDEFGAVGVF